MSAPAPKEGAAYIAALERTVAFTAAWAFEAQFALDEAASALLHAVNATQGADARLADAAHRAAQRAEHLRVAKRLWAEQRHDKASEHMRQLEALASAARGR